MAMSNISEIPCTNCHQWNAKKKIFTCNPDKCVKLSEWLLDHTSMDKAEEDEIIEVVAAPIQYVV